MNTPDTSSERGRRRPSIRMREGRFQVQGEDGVYRFPEAVTLGTDSIITQQLKLIHADGYNIQGCTPYPAVIERSSGAKEKWHVIGECEGMMVATNLQLINPEDPSAGCLYRLVPKEQLFALNPHLAPQVETPTSEQPVETTRKTIFSTITNLFRR